MTVLILCHGNICRSPSAKALMAKAGFEDTVSAGFKPDGTRCPKKLREYMAETHSIDMGAFRSSLVTKEMLETAELVLYMDGGQKKRLVALWEEYGLDQTRGELDHFCEPLGRYLNTPQDRIGDPMFAGNKDDPKFIAIMEQIAEASENFVKQRAESPIVVDEATAAE